LVATSVRFVRRKHTTDRVLKPHGLYLHFYSLHSSIVSSIVSRGPDATSPAAAATTAFQGNRNTSDKRRETMYNKRQKMNIEDSNVVPHRSTNSTRQCLTSLSRREAVLSLWYGPSWWWSETLII
ncbi:hypothetical protein THAOC_37191, partial [Thalassiosira oceanica]